MPPPAPPAMQGASRPLSEPNQALVVALPAGQGLGVAAQDDTRGTMPELPNSAIGSPVFEPVKMLCSCTCDVGWYVCSPPDRINSQQANRMSAVRATPQEIPQACCKVGPEKSQVHSSNHGFCQSLRQGTAHAHGRACRLLEQHKCLKSVQANMDGSESAPTGWEG